MENFTGLRSKLVYASFFRKFHNKTLHLPVHTRTLPSSVSIPVLANSSLSRMATTATIESRVVAPSRLLQRPATANIRSYSSYLDSSPVPENVGLEFSTTTSSSFDSAGADAKIPERFVPRKRNITMTKPQNSAQRRPQTAPAANSSKHSTTSASLRSARYLATQWRSRSTQWSASSSVRGFSETDALPSSPPPALEQNKYDSDSDSDFSITDSVDESVMSQISEARSFLESWKLRASMSQDSDDDDYKDSMRSVETRKMSANLRKSKSADEFQTEESFSFMPSMGPRGEEREQRGEKKNMSTCTGGKDTGKLKIAGIVQSPKDIRGTAVDVYASPQTLLSPANSQHSSFRNNVDMRFEPSSAAHTVRGEKPETPHQKVLQKRVPQPKPKADRITTPEPLKKIYPIANRMTKNNTSEPEKIKPITWDVYDFVFTFGVLTNQAKAPPTGEYVPDDECPSFKSKLVAKSKLLHDILNKFADDLRRIKSLSNERGKYMMCPPDCTPTVKNVRRDGKLFSLVFQNSSNATSDLIM